ncbi:excisionase family DNA-binding protein [Saccharothrix sp. CCNWYY140]|uniref:excisionase family DNA-binding protein n=1 Tax=unclassified Saccharothrix TaxID=2593673 RepID=UPI003FD32E75
MKSVTTEHYSVSEAAAYLNTSVRFVRRLIADRRVTFYKVGRYVRFKRADLEAFVQAGKVEPITAASVRRDLRRAG